MIDYKKKYLKYKKKYLQIKKIYGGMEPHQLFRTPEPMSHVGCPTGLPERQMVTDKPSLNSPITIKIVEEWEKLDKERTDRVEENKKLREGNVTTFTKEPVKPPRLNLDDL